jgi:hypothetical protein
MEPCAMQPRVLEEVALGTEATFVENMRALMAHPENVRRHGADGARLLDSWRRLQKSGVLQRRRMDEAAASIAPTRPRRYL